MLKIIVNSFSIRKIYDLRKEPLKKFILHFLFLVLLISFPLNYQIVKTGGWDLFDFTTGLREESPAWLPLGLPNDIEISQSGMYYESAAITTFETVNLEGQALTLVFAPEGGYVVSGRTLVFEAELVTYYDASSAEILSANYANVSPVVRFFDLKLAEQSDAIATFADMIDDIFSPYAILKSVLFYSLVTLVLNTLLLLVVSFIFIFLRIKFQKVTNFSDNLKIVMASMTIPSLIGFVFGILGLMELNAFTTVIFQFFTPLIAMFAIFKGAKIKEMDNRSI
jgi:hypothetical protein